MARVAGGAGVQAREQQARQRPGQLGGEDPLGRGVEAADVQRARVAQGGARGAGRERLVDVDDVERQRAQRLLDRSRDVHRQRGGPAPRRGERQHLADPEDRSGRPPSSSELRIGRASRGGVSRTSARGLRRAR